MKQVAIVDENGVYLGRREVAELAEGDIEVDDSLEPGRYRWDGTTFLPLGPGARGPMPGGVALEVAFYGLVEQLRAASIDVGPVARQWASQFEASVDALSRTTKR